jgi:hypothetical protein
MLMRRVWRALGVAGVGALLSVSGCGGHQHGTAKAGGECDMCAMGRGAAAAAVAEAEKAAAATKPSYEWQGLFDGKTLGQWKVTDFGGQGEVAVKDGKLMLPMGATLTGVTWGGAALPTMNYEIALEAQRVTGNDFFVGWTFGVNKSHCSLILGGGGGGVCGISSLDNFDASENQTSSVREFKNGQWYEVRVRVTDKKIQAWVSDERIVQVNIEGRKIDTRIEVEDCKPFGRAAWQTTAAIRDIKVRLLRPEEVAQEAASVEEEK